MSHIREIEPEEAEGELKEVYQEMIGVRGGRPSSVTRVMSLHPKGMEAVFKTGDVVAHGASTLGGRREEMIATLISNVNRCEY